MGLGLRFFDRTTTGVFNDTVVGPVWLALAFFEAVRLYGTPLLILVSRGKRLA